VRANCAPSLFLLVKMRIDSFDAKGFQWEYTNQRFVT